MLSHLLRNRAAHAAAARLIQGLVARDPALEAAVLPPQVVRGAPFALDVPEDIGRTLDAIPSETTRAERRLLYRLFAALWSGQGNVLEIGPYLGGTTRAVALGMLANPRRAAASRLITIDRFELDSFYTIERLREVLAPAVQAGLLGEADLTCVHQQQSFLPAFQRLHQGAAYESILDVRSQAMPSRPGESLAAAFQPPRGRVDAVFVDGCKTWYSLKHLLIGMAPSVPVGGWFVFQDYYDYRCFWIPYALAAMKREFEEFVRVDSTNAFVLRHALEPGAIASAMPDDAGGLDAAAADAIFDQLSERAMHREDRRARVVHMIQKAACRHARCDAAGTTSILDDVARARWAAGFEDLIGQARRKFA